LTFGSLTGEEIGDRLAAIPAAYCLRELVLGRVPVPFLRAQRERDPLQLKPVNRGASGHGEDVPSRTEDRVPMWAPREALGP
jgi:hypothetical protein